MIQENAGVNGVVAQADASVAAAYQIGQIFKRSNLLGSWNKRSIVLDTMKSTLSFRKGVSSKEKTIALKHYSTQWIGLKKKSSKIFYFKIIVASTQNPDAAAIPKKMKRISIGDTDEANAKKWFDDISKVIAQDPTLSKQQTGNLFASQNQQQQPQHLALQVLSRETSKKFNKQEEKKGIMSPITTKQPALVGSLVFQNQHEHEQTQNQQQLKSNSPSAGGLNKHKSVENDRRTVVTLNDVYQHHEHHHNNNQLVLNLNRSQVGSIQSMRCDWDEETCEEMGENDTRVCVPVLYAHLTREEEGNMNANNAASVKGLIHAMFGRQTQSKEISTSTPASPDFVQIMKNIISFHAENSKEFVGSLNDYVDSTHQRDLISFMLSFKLYSHLTATSAFNLISRGLRDRSGPLKSYLEHNYNNNSCDNLEITSQQISEDTEMKELKVRMQCQRRKGEVEQLHSNRQEFFVRDEFFAIWDQLDFQEGDQNTPLSNINQPNSLIIIIPKSNLDSRSRLKESCYVFLESHFPSSFGSSVYQDIINEVLELNKQIKMNEQQQKHLNNPIDNPQKELTINQLSTQTPVEFRLAVQNSERQLEGISQHELPIQVEQLVDGNIDQVLSAAQIDAILSALKKNEHITKCILAKHYMDVVEGNFITVETNEKDGHHTWKKYYQHDPKTGELLYFNEQLLKDQRAVVTLLLRRMGQSILSGKSIMDVSMPVEIFDEMTMLQRVARGFSLAPNFLEKAAMANNVIEQMKYSTCFLLSSFSMGINQEKPFNPIIGETLQARINGCPIYFEQTSHHPPISNYYMYGRGFDLYGCHIPVVHQKLNSLEGVLDGNPVIHFKGTNAKVKCIWNRFIVGNLMIGRRKLFCVGRAYIFESTSNLVVEIIFDGNKKTGFSSVFSSQSQIDIIAGALYEVHPSAIEEMEKLHKPTVDRTKFCLDPKTQIVRMISKLEGRWWDHIEFDGIRYWDGSRDYPFLCEFEANPLPSDSKYRLDLLYLQKKDRGTSQNFKEEMEVLQRKDQALRKKANKQQNKQK